MAVAILGTSKYRTLHLWVERHLGKPDRCEQCGIDSLPHRNYQWANISKEYKRDLNDWKRLCVICHQRFDNPNYICKRGHSIADNNYVRPSGGNQCSICKSIVRRKYYLENKK